MTDSSLDRPAASADTRPRDTALMLAGGNALGAYHAGGYEALQARGIEPGWIVGASIGAVTAAIIAGNAPEHRVERLRRFWDEATQHTAPSATEMLKLRQVYNGLHALLTLAWGRPNIFRHRLPGLWSALPGMPNDVLERANDLIFASAGRRAIAGLEREYALRQRLDPHGPAVTLLHLVHRAEADQLAAKSFDFSPSSIRDRWQAGGRGADWLAARARPERRFTYARL